MFTALSMLAMLQAAPASTETCNKLMTDFIRAEDTFTTFHNLDESMLGIEERYMTSTGDGSGWRKRRAEIEVNDAKEKLKGDRLITLMTGNGCKLPDHVFSAYTYKNDQAACKAAKGTEGEANACAYLDRAIANATKVTTTKKAVVRGKKR